MIQLFAAAHRLAPDLEETLRRFPLAVVLCALAALTAIAADGGWNWENTEMLWRTGLGALTAAGFSVAGQLFLESRPDRERLGRVLTYILPLAIVALFLARSTTWSVPWLLPAIAVQWMAISGATGTWRGAAREGLQDRFWWLTHRAATTACVAIVAFVLVWIGLLAIAGSLSLLFGIEIWTLLYRFLLPVTALFLAPLYWLSTLPGVHEFQPDDLDHPDFLSRAFAFLGQFVLVPILLAYGLILLAYAVQIALTWSLPDGTIGWMVMGFVTAGAGTYLLLHPRFIRERPVVRFFRRFWFWFTVIPLVLYALAVWTRVEAYGLTAERVLLIAGGLGAVLVTMIFLVPRLRDIRLIPATSILVLTLFSLGPWNFENWPREDQAARLAAALDRAGPNRAWTENDAQIARAAIDYLSDWEGQGRPALQRVLAARGIAYPPGQTDHYSLMSLLRLPDDRVADPAYATRLLRDPSQTPLDVSQTPFMIGPLGVYDDGSSYVGDFAIRLADNTLIAERSKVEVARLPLAGWIAAQGERSLLLPYIDFSVGDAHYRFALTDAELGSDTEVKPGEVTFLSGVLFSDQSLVTGEMQEQLLPDEP